MKRKSLIVRVWADEDGVVRGQVSDPLSKWRQSFQDGDELWGAVTLFLRGMPAVSPTLSLTKMPENKE